MANFDNKKTQGFAEETDMELNLEALDGVSGGVGNTGGSDFDPKGKSEAEVNNGQDPGVSKVEDQSKKHDFEIY